MGKKKRIRWNIDLVRDFVEGEDGNGCKLLSTKYTKMNDNMLFQCKCGESFETTYSGFRNRNKRHCEKCSSRTQWDFSLVKDFVEGKNGNGCRLLSEKYKNTSEKMKFLCICGREFKTSFGEFVHSAKRQCNECGKEIKSNKLKLSYEYVKSFIESNSDCRLLSTKYKGINNYMSLKCSCGSIFQTTFALFRESNIRKCDTCRNHVTWNIGKVKKYIKENSSCNLISDTYNNIHAKMIFVCECGNEFETRFSDFVYQDKRRCRDCSNAILRKNRSIPYDEVKKVIEIYSGSGCKLLSKEYVNIHEKLSILCKCGKTFQTSFSKFKFKNKIMCNDCSMSTSNGEFRVKQYLEKNNIAFKEEFKIDECRNERPLPFDFAIFDGESNLNMLIEYDGEFHFKPAGFSEDEKKMNKKLELQQYRDEIKNQYCKDNNIPLLRIPYWDFDIIEEILDNELML